MQPINFEQALSELERIVERLQQPNVPLEEALKLYRQGTELAAESERMLGETELQVQQLTRAVQEHVASYGAVDEDVADDEDPTSMLP